MMKATRPGDALMPVLVIRKRGRRLIRASAGSGQTVKPASHPKGFGLDGEAGGQQKSYQAVGSSRGLRGRGVLVPACLNPSLSAIMEWLWLLSGKKSSLRS